MKNSAVHLLPRILRRIVALVSLAGITSVFFVPAWGVYAGWLPRAQLLPAIFAGNALVLVLIAASVVLCGRLYCSVVCPLGIAQDVVRDLFRWLPRGASRPGGTAIAILRCSVFALFVLGAVFGFTGLIAPYGIFGRFLTIGIRRVGEPTVLLTVWAIGLFALILALTFFRARWWCNRICPVGTFLGFFSRLAVFRVRIDAKKCVKCGLCAKACDKGALAVRSDRTIAVDESQCVACFDCVGACRVGALRWRPGAEERKSVQ